MSKQMTARSLENYQTLLASDAHGWLADEPAGIGDGLGPDPYELLLSALGACTAMTVRMYARRKGWPLDDVRVELVHERVHAEDCSECESAKARIDRITVRVQVEGALDDAQRARLQEIAGRCPVRRTLGGPIQIVEG